MTNEEALRLLHAYADGELDPARMLELEAHLAANPSARAACERLRGLSAAIRAKADYHAAPAGLAERLAASIPPAPVTRPRRFAVPRWLPSAAAVAGFALLAWIAATVAMRPGEDERLAAEVLDAHVRSTLAGRPFDVASSDQHTVKPWLSARLPFSPPVADLSAQGFELTGGRLDYVGGRRVAVLAYKRRQHLIDVFVWPSAARPHEPALTRDGFNIERFARDGMEFWVVSDLNRNELGDFARLLAEHSAL
ncbi:MAG TPA: anti-sigma factor [Burkholderiales bacterium]|nr:anti-sigma factor [Burkholderiales bacterium]